ncbi:hypothetical protein [Kitasatospora sp. NPDC094015]
MTAIEYGLSAALLAGAAMTAMAPPRDGVKDTVGRPDAAAAAG